MSDRVRRRVGPWERRRLAGIFSAFQRSVSMTLRHQRAEFSEQPPKAAPDNACRSRRGSGGAGFASAPVRNRAERGKQVVWLQTARLTRGPGNARIFLFVPAGTRVPVDEFVRRGGGRSGRASRGCISVGEPALAAPPQVPQTPPWQPHNWPYGGPSLTARPLRSCESRGSSGSGDPVGVA